MVNNDADLSDLAGQWRVALLHWAEETAAHYRGGSQTTRLSHLRRMARHLTAQGIGPWDAGTRHLRLWLGDQTHLSPEYQRSSVSSARVFYAWATETERVPKSPAGPLKQPPVPRPCPRPAPRSVIAAALGTAPPDVLVAIQLMAFCGLRRAEAAQVRVDDIEPPDHPGAPGRLLVRGKGAKRRIVPLPHPTWARIHALPQHPSGWLFPSPSPARPGMPRTPANLGKLVRRHLPGKWTCHTMRHHAAAAWRDAGLDIDEIGDLLGHASPVTTRIYLPPRQDRMSAAVAGVAAGF